MNRDIERQLQECLDGYDGGLTPEECLSAYPRTREELEPLFRQALSLRVAFAASPKPEFRSRAREKLLFAAGRDVKQALSAEPDPQFVSTARRRLLNRAGAEAQEALRDVPPPRLPFWANARRRLLENASAGPPRPAPRMSPSFRYALSAAVIVLAVAIAGAGFFLENSPANQPSQTAVRAELDYISEQVKNFEQLRAQGEVVSSSELEDLAERTSKLAEQYSAGNPNSELLGKLPDLIERQQTLLSKEDGLDESLSAAQKRLDEANEKVPETTAETSPEPTSESSGAATSPTAVSTPEPTASPSTTPDIPPVALVSPSDLADRQVILQYDASETALGLRWWRVTTNTITFVIPEEWSLRGISTDEDGLAVLPADYIFVETNVNGMLLAINTVTGEVKSIDPPANLRGEGASGAIIDPSALANLAGSDSDWASIYNMLDSVTLVAATPATATPTPTASSTSTPTATPSQTIP